MAKKINFTIYLIFLVGLSNCLLAQKNEPNISILFRDSQAIDIFKAFNKDGFPVLISSVSKNARPVRGSNSSQVYYQGELLKGVAFLYNSNIFYVKTKGKIPEEFVYYYGAKGFDDTINTREQILNVLSDKYKFRISNINDSCDVWKVQKIDTTKFVLFNPEKDEENHGCGNDDAGTGLACIGYPLSFVYASIEWKAKIMVVGDEYDFDRRNQYNFNIPYSIMTDLDKLNKFLEERYGIKFIKTKVLQKLKLIEFEN